MTAWSGKTGFRKVPIFTATFWNTRNGLAATACIRRRIAEEKRCIACGRKRSPPLYEKSDSSETALASNFTRFAVPQVSVQGKNITLSNVEKNASVRLVSVMGHVEEIRPHGDSFQAQVASGRYVLLVHEINRQISIPVSVK